jgi:hypothetical protein
MLAFKKHILPFQREGDALAFNIRPLDTILYNNATFREKGDRAIDGAILAAGTTSRPTRSLASSEALLRYIAVCGLSVTNVSSGDAAALYRLGSPLGFLLLDGPKVVYFGVFDQEPAKEVVFRLKLLLQNLHNARHTLETSTMRTFTAEQIETYRRLWDRIEVRVLISKEVEKARIAERVRELTKDLQTVPWTLLGEDDVQASIAEEYATIGDL